MYNRIKVILFFLMFSVLFSEERTGTVSQITDSAKADLKSLIDHANSLVRDNKFRTALHFYDTIFAVIDSVESSEEEYPYDLETLRISAENHFNNLKALIAELDIDAEEDNGLFCFSMDDFNMDENDSEKIEYQPFPDKELKSVKKWIDRYTKNNRKTFQIYLDRSADYIDEVKKIFRHFGLPEELAFVPMAESGYLPFAHSFAKASGIWQFIPSTGRIFGLESNWWEDDRKNIIKATIAAARFYKHLYEQFGDWNLVLASYNCGSGNVRKAVKKHKTDNFWSLCTLPKETREYVPRLRALVTIAKDPGKYGFSIRKQTAYHDTVMLDSCISLNAVALSAGITYEDIKRMNPQLRQWCLPPYAKNYTLMIPAESKVMFRKNLDLFSEDEKYPVSEYTVEAGDNISRIAKKFKVSSSAVTDLNNGLKELKPGDVLKILKPPTDMDWFKNFNNRYLSYYDEEEYYLDGRKKLNYRVRKGDSVWGISKKFNVSSHKLKAWNKIGNSNIIKPGQNIIIYL